MFYSSYTAAISPWVRSGASLKFVVLFYECKMAEYSRDWTLPSSYNGRLHLKTNIRTSSNNSNDRESAASVISVQVNKQKIKNLELKVELDQFIHFRLTCCSCSHIQDFDTEMVVEIVSLIVLLSVTVRFLESPANLPANLSLANVTVLSCLC